MLGFSILSWRISNAATGSILPDIITRGSTTTIRCNQDADRGKVFVDTDATSGRQIYACEGSSGWVLQGDGGGAGSGDIEGVTAGNGLTGGGTSGTVTLHLIPGATQYIHNQNNLQEGSTSHVRTSYVNRHIFIGTSTYSTDTSTSIPPLTISKYGNTEGYGVDHNDFMRLVIPGADTSGHYLGIYSYSDDGFGGIYYDPVASFGYTGSGNRFQFRDSAGTVAGYVDVDDDSGTLFGNAVQFNRLAPPQPNAISVSSGIARASYFHRVHAETIPVVITLPDISQIDGDVITKHQYIFCKADTSSNTVSFTAGTNDDIDSSATLNYPNQCLMLISSVTSGTNKGRWFVAMKSWADLATPGVVNVSTNPVDWSLLKNVPAGFADGTDDGGGGGSYVSSITVNGTTVTNPDLDDDEPAAVSDSINVIWQTDGTNISAYVPYNSATMEVVGGGLSAIPGAGSGNGVSGSTGSIGISIDGGGSAIVAGSTRSITVPFSCTISSWTVVADQSGSIAVHVSSSTFANYPTLSNMSGFGNGPNLSSQQKKGSPPTSWNQTSVNQGSIISFVVDSASTVKWVNIILWVIKT